ncbi:MAG: hypothetical protein KBI30_03660 [Candidatus Atribacteria bacterium]|nr:hypothetical protein [Candidatus Atribacteria bacterium]
MDRKIIKIIKWFLLLSLIFSSLYLFNYSYFKGNNGMFFLNALDSAGGKIDSYIAFDVDSPAWFLFRPYHLKQRRDCFGRLRSFYKYKTPYTDPIYVDNGKQVGCVIDFWYLNLKACPGPDIYDIGEKPMEPFLRSNSAIVFYYVLTADGYYKTILTPDDYKIIESFQNTKRVPYLKSIALQIKTMPKFLKSELNYIKTDQNILLEMPMLFLTVLFSIPYLYLQVIIPSSLSIPFFWLWIGFSVFYIVTPYKILKRLGEKVKGLLHKRSNN